MQGTLIIIFDTYIKPFAGFLVLAGVVTVGIQLLINAYKPRERAESMSSLLWVGIGSIIFGMVIAISSLFVNMSETMITVPGVLPQDTSQAPAIPSKDATSWIIDIICLPLTALIDSLQYIANYIGGLLYGSNIMDASKFNIGTVLFSDSSRWFPQSMINTTLSLMALIALGVSPLIIISVAKVGAEYMLSPLSINLRKDASESLSRWFFCIILVGLAPIFVIANLELNSGIVSWLHDITIKNGNIASINLGDVRTGTLLGTSLVKLVFSLIAFYMILLFEIRKIMIIVFTVFTPVAAYLWSINKNINAAQIWFGEILSNIYMQFFYAFVYTIYTFFSMKGTLNWVESMIWLFMIIIIGEALRNSLQGLITRLSGVNESSVPGKMMAGALALTGISSSYKAAKTTFEHPGNFVSSKTAGSAANGQGNTGEDNISASSTSSGMYGVGNASPVNAMGRTVSVAQSSTPIYGHDGRILSMVKTDDNATALEGDGIHNDDGRENPNNAVQKVPLMMDAQRRLAKGISTLNKVSNAVGRMVSIPLALASAPLGMHAMKAAMGIGYVISGGIRAVGTRIAIDNAVRDVSNAYGLSKDDSHRLMMNSTSKQGANRKTRDIIANNIRNDHDSLEDMFLRIQPNNEKQYVRWNYCPATADIDHFRWADKEITPSDVRI